MVWEMAMRHHWKDGIVTPKKEVQVDRTAAISMEKNAAGSMRTKHVEMRYHQVREKIEPKIIRLSKFTTDARRFRMC